MLTPIDVEEAQLFFDRNGRVDIVLQLDETKHAELLRLLALTKKDFAISVVKDEKGRKIVLRGML